MRRAKRRLVISLFAVFAVSILATGCGVEGQQLTDASTTVAPDQAGVPSSDLTLSTEDIAATKPDSPERTVLTWWRAMQTRDTKTVIDSYTDDARKSLPEGFEFSIVSYLAPIAGQSTLTIDSVETNGGKSSGKGKDSKNGGSSNADVAVVYVSIDSPAPNFAGTVALPTKKESGGWLISDNTFVVALVNAIFEQSQAAAASTNSSG